MYFKFYLSLLLAVNQLINVSTATPLFYMYELDEAYWWRWPDDDVDCSNSGYVTHQHSELSGMGREIDASQGMFLTWHGSIFSALYNRYKRSKYRTLDPEQASVFIVPYDMCLDGFLNAKACTNRRACSPHLVDPLSEMLGNSTYFTRHHGIDHVFLWSLGNYHPWPRHCFQLMKGLLAHSVFTCYWMDAYKSHNQFVSIPFSATYHWWDNITDIPWSVTNPLAPERNYTALYLGSLKTLNPDNTKIRRAMGTQCQEHAKCTWKQVTHTSTDSSIATLLGVYRRTVFCLCPPGDDPTRKAVFDIIVSGCIPVFFHSDSIYNQYPWHLGEEAAHDISVYIPGRLLRAGTVNFMDVLLAIPESVIKLKQARIAELAPRLQYAMPPLDMLRNRADASRWDPPFPDAAEVTLLGIFERTGNLIRNESIPLNWLNNRTKSEWKDAYGNHVYAKVPGQPLTPFEYKL